VDTFAPVRMKFLSLTLTGLRDSHSEQITYQSYLSGFISGLGARPDAWRGSAAQRPSSPGSSRRSSQVLYPASHQAAAREDYRWDGTEGSVRGGVIGGPPVSAVGAVAGAAVGAAYDLKTRKMKASRGIKD
jgi:hypothetical protein